MWKFLIFGLLGFLLYKMFVLDKKKKGENKENVNEKMYAQGKMAKDPICGAYVSVSESSIKVKDGNTIHRFCSYDCRDAFLEKLRAEGRQIPESKNNDDDE
nr:transcriptional regulator [Desulfovibrio litoralis]